MPSNKSLYNFIETNFSERNSVIYAYRYLLDRNPENHNIVLDDNKSWNDLKRDIVESQEYIMKNLYTIMAYDVFTTNKLLRESLDLYKDLFEGILERNYSKIISPGDHVIDIGAHVGRHSSVFLSLIGNDGMLYAFEPLPEQYEHLCSNLNGANLDIRNVALSDESGEMDFCYVVNYPEESGLKKRLAYSGEAEVTTIKVIVETLDSYIDNFTKVDYIKLDAEGAELAILRGGIKTISKHRPIINVEFGGTNYIPYGVRQTDLYDFCYQLDYLITDVFGNQIPTRDAWAEICDTASWDYFLIPSEKIRFFWTSIHKQND